MSSELQKKHYVHKLRNIIIETGYYQVDVTQVPWHTSALNWAEASADIILLHLTMNEVDKGGFGSHCVTVWLQSELKQDTIPGMLTYMQLMSNLLRFVEL